MKTILVVDDDLQLRKVKYETALKGKYNVIYTENANSIFNVIRKSKVDLYIVDLNLDQFIDPERGDTLSVFEVLKAIGKYKPVILLSASYDDLFKKDRLTPIINNCLEEGYNICSYFTWGKIVEASQDESEYGSRFDLYESINISINKDREQYDFGLVCALEEELKPFLDLTTIVQHRKISGIDYIKGSILTQSGRKLNFVSAYSMNMGIAEAGIIATHMTSQLKVKTIYMIGVCGGRDNEVNVGDIIIPKESIAFQRGKLTDNRFSRDIQSAKPKDQGFIRSINSSVILNELFSNYTNEYRNRYHRTIELDEPKVHYESMACSDFVIDKDEFLNQIPEDTAHRKLCGVDMESYAIYRVGEMLDVNTMVIKSVMDLTKDKSDKYKPYAAYMAANYLYQLLYREEIKFDKDN